MILEPQGWISFLQDRLILQEGTFYVFSATDIYFSRLIIFLDSQRLRQIEFSQCCMSTKVERLKSVMHLRMDEVEYSPFCRESEVDQRKDDEQESSQERSLCLVYIAVYTAKWYVQWKILIFVLYNGRIRSKSNSPTATGLLPSITPYPPLPLLPSAWSDVIMKRWIGIRLYEYRQHSRQMNCWPVSLNRKDMAILDIGREDDEDQQNIKNIRNASQPQ